MFLANFAPLQKSVKCKRIGAKYFYLFCILKWVIQRVKNSETVFPGKILIPIVSSLLNVSVTPSNILNLSVHLLSVPAFLGALELEAVFRKQAAMLANTCMWPMCCYSFKHYRWFTCRCFPLFYSLTTIYFLNSWKLYAYIEVSVYIGFPCICILYTVYCSIY